MSHDFEQLLSFCSRDGRICPQPLQWNELYRMLPETKRVGSGREPAPPLILAAWWETSDIEKRERFKQHLCWAHDHDALRIVTKFLHSLAET
jgi:hypothetical protein